MKRQMTFDEIAKAFELQIKINKRSIEREQNAAESIETVWDRVKEQGLIITKTVSTLEAAGKFSEQQVQVNSGLMTAIRAFEQRIADLEKAVAILEVSSPLNGGTKS
jgi:excinuclease UvrABC ATPase subunit